jgi:hypothetical protein
VFLWCHATKSHVRMPGAPDWPLAVLAASQLPLSFNPF